MNVQRSFSLTWSGVICFCASSILLFVAAALANQEMEPASGMDPAAAVETEEAASEGGTSRTEALIASLTIFVLAIFVGFEIITKVPPTLHTPLMSGSNAISGITLVGALLVAGSGLGASSWLALVAVVMATINAVGGFLVTHRMLAMFKKR